MGTSKAGYILALISGILGILGGLSMLLMGSSAGDLLGGMGASVVIGLGIFVLIISGLLILAGKWMKNPEKCFKGGLLALILGVLSGNLLAVIAGILGMVQAKKTDAPVEAEPVAETAEPVAEAPVEQK